jgi:outer membrane biosynthesis protein TonB
MRKQLSLVLSLTLLVIAISATSALAQGSNENDMLRHSSEQLPNKSNLSPGVGRRPLRINPNFQEPSIAAASLPKGAVHLTVRSDSDARQIFTSFPYPSVAARPGAMGVYRLEVNSQGTVAAVTILKSMGARRDARVMKTCVGWRAKPGQLRIVDISWQMS